MPTSSVFDPMDQDMDYDKKPDVLQGRRNEKLLRVLFSEELGALIQVRRGDRETVTAVLRAAGFRTILLAHRHD